MKGVASAPAENPDEQCWAKCGYGNGGLEASGTAALDSRADPGIRDTLKSAGGAAAPGEPLTPLRVWDPERSPRVVGLTPVAAVRYCRMLRSQVRPAPLTLLMSGLHCLFPTGPTVFDAW